MSRIGRKPVAIPGGVKVKIDGSLIEIEGPKGKLSQQVPSRITIEQQGDQLVCNRDGDDREAKSLHGLMRSLIQNMVLGVTQGFERRLEIVGVGYGAIQKGKEIELTVGFANKVMLPIPESVTLGLPDPTHVVISGPDKQAVGQFAAEVRAVRKPEPYKGTGIRYQGEQIRRKAGKAFGSGG